MTGGAPVPDWVVYPSREWPRLSPAEAGFRQPEFDAMVNACQPRPSTFWGECHAPGDYGAVWTRGGYMVQEWGRAHDYRYQTASVGKAFTLAALGLAVEKLGLDPDAPVWHTWTGAGEFSREEKRFDSERHRHLTWRHLAEHTAGFAIENAAHWRAGVLPEEDWIRAAWTGDPDRDMVALRPPGRRFYSSANYVRLGQALTAVWGEDLKSVLDRELFAPMDLPVDRWDWFTLQQAREARDLYPASVGYAEYADPPFHVAGAVVRGGPGWVVMAAADLARFGLLVASAGWWRGQRLLGPEWLVSKSGGNWSTVVGDRHSFVAGARVATEGLPGFLWVPDFVAYRFPPELLDPGVKPGSS